MIEILNEKFISDKEASHLYGYSVSWFQNYSIKELDKWFKNNILIYK